MTGGAADEGEAAGAAACRQTKYTGNPNIAASIRRMMKGVAYHELDNPT